MTCFITTIVEQKPSAEWEGTCEEVITEPVLYIAIHNGKSHAITQDKAPNYFI